MTDTLNPGAAAAAPAKAAVPVKAGRTPFQWPETRTVLATLSTGLMAVAYVLPWLMSMPMGSEQAIGQLQGAIILQWGAVMSWYFGSSKSSAAKDDTIAALSKPAA